MKPLRHMPQALAAEQVMRLRAAQLDGHESAQKELVALDEAVYPLKQAPHTL